MSKLFIFFILLLPASCLAQFNITGRVLSLDDKKPVPYASVFLSNATIGTSTADNGTFTLYSVRPGKYTLVVSVIGYETFTQVVFITNSDLRLNVINLFSKSTNLKEVSVKPDPNREKYLSMFKDQFLGRTGLARQCKILNPDVIDLAYNDLSNTLTASSYDFIEIENAGLGYKIRYKLDDFEWLNNDTAPVIRYEGNFLFEALKGPPSAERRWQKTREEVYKNSSMHFYRTLLSGKITREGFKIQQFATYANPDRPADSVIYSKIKYYEKNHILDTLKYWQRELKMPKMLSRLRPDAMTQQDVLNTTNQPGLYAVGCDLDALYITYNENSHFDDNAKLTRIYNPGNTETTLISFNTPFAFIDANGIVANPYSIFYTGVWANKRVADLLPIDYDEKLQTPAVPLDSTVLKNVTVKLNDYAANHPIEKAYLHFDRPYYAAGDTMYFKAYLTAGGQHQPSGISGILHVDLINGNDYITRSINLEVNNGVAWGDFVLPDSTQKGNYRVRAYTQWMRNENEKGFFEQTIPVGAGKKLPGILISPQVMVAKPDIQFFPEGGSLVTGLKSKIAFKAIGSNGLGIAIKGEVSDNDNKTICSFTTAHLGMGYFYIIPEEGKTYKAKISYPNGTQDVFDLPVPKAKGIVLSVNNDSTLKAAVTISANKACYQEYHNKDYTLVVYSGGSLTSYICKLDTQVVLVDILKRELRSGIARVTLFSPAGEPLAERLLFIQNYDGLKLNISTDKARYAKREKVNIKLNASNADGEPAAGHFSVSVTDEGKVPVQENAEHTILTDLLLTSDLKGYVEQPNYYFGPNTGETFPNLDVLMLTQGYRHFEWQQVLVDTSTTLAWQPENLFHLSGTITTLSGKPVPNGNVTLLSLKQHLAKDTTTDKNGKFDFTGLYLTDTAKLVLNARKQNNGTTVNIQVDKSAIPEVTEAVAGSDDMITPEATALLQKQYDEKQNFGKNGILLKQVNVKSYNTKAYMSHMNPVLTHSENLNGPGEADQVIMGDKLEGCPQIADCLQSLIHGGVRLVMGGSPVRPIFYSTQTPIELNGPTKPMAVSIDGVITDQSELDQVSPTDIYSIEILESHSFLTLYGSAASGGLIVITTKRGDEEGVANAVVPGVITYKFNGFYKAREFYSPKYEASAPANSQPDLRTTIFWKPELITEPDGNASFDFYNGDGPGTYRVVVEGIDVNGNIGRRVYRYKVE